MLKTVSAIKVRQNIGNREDFFRLYSSLQNNADVSGAVDDDLSEALAFARQ